MWVSKEKEETEEGVVLREDVVTLAEQVYLDELVPREFVVTAVGKVCKVYKDHKEYVATRVLKANVDPMEKWVIVERTEKGVLLVTKEERAEEALRDGEVYLDRLDEGEVVEILVQMVLLVLQAKGEYREHKASLGSMDHQVKRDREENEDDEELVDEKETGVMLVPMEPMETMVKRVFEVDLVTRADRDTLVLWAKPETMEPLVRSDFRVLLDHKVPPAFLVERELRVK